MPSPSLLQRLKERKLVQWAVAYLAGAFVVFQLLDALEVALGLTPTIQRGILVIVGIGFLITLILAWYHGEKGRQRVSGPELLMVTALLVVAGVALSLLGGREGLPEQTGNTASLPLNDDRPSVAVLLCDNFSPNPEDAFRAQGIHEEILLRLQGISSLRSIGRTSVLQFADDPPEVSEIATALRVGFVGECSVLKDPDQSHIRVTFQLLDASGTQVWADRYDRDLTVADIYEIQDDIAERVAHEIGAVLTPEEQARIESRATDDLQAYDFYLLGRDRWLTRDPDSLLQALDFFNNAIARDSLYAPAFAGLASTHLMLPQYAAWLVDHHEAYAQGKEAARKAVALDPGLSEAHAVLGSIAYVYDWDWDVAEEELLRAIDLGPSNADAFTFYSELLNSLGRYEEALDAAKQAVALNPSYTAANALLAFSYWHTGQLDASETQFRHLLELDPDYPQGYLLWYLLESQNRHDEARAIRRSQVEWMNRRAADEVLGEEEDSLMAAWTAAFLDPESVPQALALLDRSESGWLEYFWLGAYPEAMDRLLPEIADRGYGFTYLNWPMYSNFLGQDPRYPGVLQEIGLPPPPDPPPGMTHR